ncbi:hypothetical protein HK101_002097 [Irineochytrium annulatum]|nr:hypothetical protein HK101_002097 [Irineochytrium annulatum]
MDVVNEMRGLQELSVDLDRHIMGSTDEVVRVRMNHLRKIRLMWYVPSTDVTARLFIVDWEEVKRVGLPSLEELEINIGNFDQGSFGEDQKEFPAILYDAVLDVAKTPALVFADVDLNGKTEQYFFKLKGGRGNFCAKKLAEMREEFEGIV